ncbi:MAG: hypothetical protein ACK5PZ_09205, partial [Pirellula sp.]
MHTASRNNLSALSLAPASLAPASLATASPNGRNHRLTFGGVEFRGLLILVSATVTGLLSGSTHGQERQVRPEKGFAQGPAI